ncbi:MAG: YchJ family metal-binding protein [Cellvibrionaceae bacterium]
MLNRQGDPCGKKSFEQCCGRFLNGGELAKTPEQLMRSRYTAYALGGHGKYLLQTWFPATAGGLTEEELSDKKLDWRKLEILNRSQHGDEGVVEFKAWFLRGINEKLEAMHEISEFRRVNGRWYYIGGRVD